MFIIFYFLWVAGPQGLRVFLSLCLYVFATLRLCDLFDCKNITKNLSRQTDNFDMIIDVVDER